MQNKQESSKESGKVQLALLVAVALAAGSAGVWSELHAAGATVTKSAGNAVFAFGNGVVDIEDNGDGTGFTAAMATLPDGSMLNGFNFANPDYSVSADVRPGQAGKGTGSGTASATINGMHISADWSTFEPIILQASVAVDGASDVSAYLFQGISVSINPLTGESSVNRRHSVGNSAYGDTAGAFSISVDGSNAYEESGVFGGVAAYSQHSIVRIK